MHAEIRGRGRSWKVWTPDQAGMAHTIPLYDQDGVLKDTLLVGAADRPKYVECYGGPFASVEEAIEYARYLGYEDVRVHRTMTKTQALAKARATRQKGDTTDE